MSQLHKIQFLDHLRGVQGKEEEEEAHHGGNLVGVDPDVLLADGQRLERLLTVGTEERAQLAMTRLVTVQRAPGREGPAALVAHEPRRAVPLVRQTVRPEHPLGHKVAVGTQNKKANLTLVPLAEQ